jgi:cobyrinic acid a,c-diamide synthase
MPKMDDGPTDGPPGRELRSVSVHLTPAEAQDLLESLVGRAEEDYPDPGWHTHITDDEGRELTIWVSGDAIIHNRLAGPSTE